MKLLKRITFSLGVGIITFGLLSYFIPDENPLAIAIGIGIMMLPISGLFDDL